MDGLDEIAQIIKDKKCIPFLGAGTSRKAGCSDWDSIPSKLQSLPILKSAIENNPSLLPQSTNRQQRIEILINQLGPNQINYYHEILRDTLHCPASKVMGDYSILIKAIKKISSFLDLIITTNADNCLETTDYFPPIEYPIYFSLEDFKIINLNKKGIYHIHGHRNELKNTVFTEKSYKERYSDRGFENFLCYVFRQYTMLFIGKNLEDDKPLMKIIEQMKERTHYSLARVGKYSPEEKTNLIEKYNIKIIEYPNHDSLPSLMKGWVDKNFPESSLQEPKTEEPTHAI